MPSASVPLRGGADSGAAAASACAPQPPSCDDACGELLAYILEQRRAVRWSAYYEEIAAFLRESGVARESPATLVEVGTAWGGLAHHLLQGLPHLRLVAVDPFLPYDPGDVQSSILERVQQKYSSLGGRETGSELWARAMRFDMVGRFGCRYALIHAASSAAAEEAARNRSGLFPAGIDAAFIDGDHTYRGIETDLAAWRRVVREGGLLLFNDYGFEMFPGVQAMVDAHAAMTGQEVIFVGDPEHHNVVLRNLPFDASR